MNRIGLLLVLVLATAIRLFQLPERVVWFDEAVSLLVAQASPSEIVSAAQDDTHPPLYNLALHYWLKVTPQHRGCGGPRFGVAAAGEETTRSRGSATIRKEYLFDARSYELAARGFSVLCGVLTVAVVFLIGRKLAGSTAGLVSAGLLALCPLHVWYSQEIRMYALQTLLVTASWWLLLARRWPWYAVVTALSLYTQYTSAFAVVAQGVYVVWRERAVLRSWLWSVAAVAVMFAPGVPLLARQYGGGTFGYWLKEFSWADPLRFLALLSGAIPKNPGPYWPWAVVSLVVVVLAAIRTDTQKRVPPLLWVVVPVGLLAVLSVRANVFLPRTLVMVAPAFALLLGLAVVSSQSGRWLSLKAMMTALVVAGNLVALSRYYWGENAWIRSDLRAAAARVVAEYRPGDLVVHTSRFSYRPFQFYLDPAIPQAVEKETEAMPALFKVIGSRGLPADATGVRRVWLVLFPDFQRRDAGTATAAWLQKHPRQVIRLDCGGAAL
jgi:4-amino-4-deoxy-L-arabinose transferase-like glycosyltransferase